MENNFIRRLQKTSLTDIAGMRRNLHKFVYDMLEMPQDQPDGNFRRLLREILETESGVTGEESWKETMPLYSRRGVEKS